jgi:hypothetical protein
MADFTVGSADARAAGAGRLTGVAEDDATAGGDAGADRWEFQAMAMTPSNPASVARVPTATTTGHRCKAERSLASGADGTDGG